MAVYVDELRQYRDRGTWCHMSADTNVELEKMARNLRLRPQWKQRGHYDVTPYVRARAILYGAVEITSREMVGIRKRLEQEGT